MAKEMIIEKSIGINKPKNEVFEYLKYVKHQDEFSVWNMADPNKKAVYTRTDGKVGFVYSWESKNKNVGVGSQEIKNIIDGESILYELRFEKPMKNIAESKFVLKTISSNVTQVSWNFKGPTKFPMSLFASLFKKMLGKDMSKSLENLKMRLEK